MRSLAELMQREATRSRRLGRKTIAPRSGPGLYLPEWIIRQKQEEPAEDDPRLRHVRVYVTTTELFGSRPSEADVVVRARRLPADWVVIACAGMLGHLDLASDKRAAETAIIQQLVPAAHRERLEQGRTGGALFLHEEQLLGACRLAILHGTDEQVVIPSAAQVEDLFWLLLGCNDLHGAEMENMPGTDPFAQFTSLEIRSLGYGVTEERTHVLLRSEAYWFQLPPTLADHTDHVPVLEEFRHAAGVDLSTALAATHAAMTHGLTVIDSTAPMAWAFDAASWLQTSPRSAELTEALAPFSADGSWFRARFEEPLGPQAPRYLGAALRPFRERPLVRLSDGRHVVLSARFATAALRCGVFWTLVDHLRATHGTEAERRFTRFFGRIFERYVKQLLASVFDLPGLRRTFDDVEAQPSGSGPDVAIFVGDHIYFVEACVTRLRYGPTLLAGSIDAFDEDIHRSVVAKARQLSKAIERFRLGKLRYPGHPTRAEREQTIWPILVLEQPLPIFELTGQRISSALRDAGLESLDPPVTVLSVDELELLIGFAPAQKVRTLIAQKRDDPVYRHQSFRNFLADRLTDVAHTRPPYMADLRDRQRQRVAEELQLPSATSEVTRVKA